MMPLTFWRRTSHTHTHSMLVTTLLMILPFFFVQSIRGHCTKRRMKNKKNENQINDFFELNLEKTKNDILIQERKKNRQPDI